MNTYHCRFIKRAYVFVSIMILILYSSISFASSIASWQQKDIGQVNYPGNAVELLDVITLTGSGNDIWGEQDDFYYVYIPVTGNASITVRVLSVENTHPWAKGAVMFRETLATGAKNVALDYSAHEYVALQWRADTNARSNYWGKNVGQGPVWLKLTRDGDIFTGHYSFDGTNWQLTTQKTIPMTEDIYLGLAASPHVTTQNNIVQFDGLLVESSNATNACQIQGAQCGAISDGNGGTLECGVCSTNEACDLNLCQPIDNTQIVAACNAFGAQCGVIRDGLGNTLGCGTCDTGSTCSSNRCEASCALTQIDNGTFDHLFSYTPLQFTYTDLSDNQHPVTTSLREHNSEGLFPFESRVDMNDKSVTIDFTDKSVSTPMTLSFKLTPTTDNQSGTVLSSDSLVIEEVLGKINSTLSTQTNPITVNNDNGMLKHRSCNHYALQLSNDKITTFLNGHQQETLVDTSQLHALAGQVTVGPYAGKVWDLRVFNDSLSSDQIQALGEECSDTTVMNPPDPEYPLYLCGAYYCIFWPEGITDTTQESFEYQLSGHDMTWEHNVMTTGMYKHEAFCAEFAKPRQLLLTEGYRKSWVSKFNFDSPWNQYVLHENFHAYQSRTGGSTKFLAESSASWGAFSQKPTAKDTLLGYYTLQPQLSLWTTQSSVFEDGIIDYYKGGHQYGASIFEHYVTHNILSDNFIGYVFNRNVHNLAPLSGKPTEAMYTILENSGFDMREVFSDFTARIMTWDMPFGDTFLASEIASYNRMVSVNNRQEEPYPEEEIDNKVTEFYDVNGTGDAWHTVPSRYKIASWAYNAYEVDVTEDTLYEIGINPAITNPNYAEFRVQIVVYNPVTGERIYHKLPETSAGNPEVMDVNASAGDILYLVVASTPSTRFINFESYNYDYIIRPK
ncbi:hypothetical protein [uncultured Shewanella sp.]|uniref:hypothetical protein n=1 Tax=uncultured Shewanella sp. TaxID=173975 RepID=UPI00260574C6|nr:hypothetical protein [uncultured Shewanella sp.]